MTTRVQKVISLPLSLIDIHCKINADLVLTPRFQFKCKRDQTYCQLAAKIRRFQFEKSWWSAISAVHFMNIILELF